MIKGVFPLCFIVGDWMRNLKNGYGTMYYSNGTEFSGLFREGRKNGPGQHISATGQCTTGTWRDGKLVGKGEKRQIKDFKKTRREEAESAKESSVAKKEMVDIEEVTAEDNFTEEDTQDLDQKQRFRTLEPAQSAAQGPDSKNKEV